MCTTTRTLKNFDTDGDHDLSYAERSSVKEIEVTEETTASSVKTLEGIQYFPNLQILTCNNSSVMSLDLSKNTELFTLMCVYNSKLTSIDLSGNRKLSGMQYHNNALKTIDISNTSLLMTDVNYALMGCQNVSVDTTVIMRPKQYAIYSSKWCVKPENARITCDVHYSTLYTPTGLTEIASEAFANSRFDRVSLGYQVSKIGSNAFKDCKMLCQVYFNSYNVSIADDAFTGCTDLTFYCYEGSSAHTYAIEHNIQFVIMPGPSFM